MPNIKSAKKRVSVTAAKTTQNRVAKTNLKTYIKKANIAVADEDASQASAAFKEAQARIDKAVSKGLMHKNTAARRKSALALKLTGK